MLPIILTALILVGIMGACPGTQLGQTLRRWLVEAPARALARISPRQLIGPAMLAVAGGVLFVLFEAEGLRLFAMAAPELLGWAVMFDITVTLDLVAASLTVAGVARLRPLIARLGIVAASATAVARALPRRAARALRTRTIRRPGPASKDDAEPLAGYALA